MKLLTEATGLPDVLALAPLAALAGCSRLMQRHVAGDGRGVFSVVLMSVSSSLQSTANFRREVPVSGIL